mmetsp:Transcript_41335/g.123432  ORF Transcript_41335/g.123432 Transcript_41335/m.123432 type:complete len:248 (-) Transcript_41335:2060-2803(-)
MRPGTNNRSAFCYSAVTGDRRARPGLATLHTRGTTRHSRPPMRCNCRRRPPANAAAPRCLAHVHNTRTAVARPTVPAAAVAAAAVVWAWRRTRMMWRQAARRTRGATAASIAVRTARRSSRPWPGVQRSWKRRTAWSMPGTAAEASPAAAAVAAAAAEASSVAAAEEAALAVKRAARATARAATWGCTATAGGRTRTPAATRRSTATAALMGAATRRKGMLEARRAWRLVLVSRLGGKHRRTLMTWC